MGYYSGELSLAQARDLARNTGEQAQNRAQVPQGFCAECDRPVRIRPTSTDGSSPARWVHADDGTPLCRAVIDGYTGIDARLVADTADELPGLVERCGLGLADAGVHCHVKSEGVDYRWRGRSWAVVPQDDEECSCAMTESSQASCPVHGEQGVYE